MGKTLKEVLFNHLASENAHDLKSTIATLHEDCVIEDRATGQVWRGRQGAADHYRQWWQAFDVEVVRRPGQSAHWVGEEGYIAEATWVGTHIGDFLSIAPTGRRIEQPFVVFVRFKDGLLVGETFYYDLATLLRQLGVERIPEVASLAHR